MVPPERLLIWNIKDGWEPLCNFLDKPIPPKPIPHENKSGDKNAFFRSEKVTTKDFWQENKYHVKKNSLLLLLKTMCMTGFVVYEVKHHGYFTKTIANKLRNIASCTFKM